MSFLPTAPDGRTSRGLQWQKRIIEHSIFILEDKMRFVETVLAYLFAPLTIFLRIWDHLQGPTIPLGALGLIAALLTMVAIVSGVPVNGVLYVGGLAYLLTLFFYNRLGEVHVQHVETKCMVASLLAGCALTWMIFVFVLLI